MADRLKDNNLIGPHLEPDGEAQKFVRDHRCLCGRFLTMHPHTERGQWYFKCPEHDVILGEGYIRRGAAERVETNQAIGRGEMREKSGKTVEELLKEMGL